MTSKYNEQALESLIEKALTGLSLEDLKEQGTNIADANDKQGQYLSGAGYYLGDPLDFDKSYALDTYRFWNFLQATQAKELAKLQVYGDWKLKILERYDRMVKKYGVLRVLKKGLDLDNAHFTLFYEAPSASSAQAVRDNFEYNQFAVTRQVRYSNLNPGEEIDMVITVNGIPLCRLSLKILGPGRRLRYREYTSINIRVIVTNPYCSSGVV
ncbi:type I restriction endonuclease [Sphingobacterium multivorum]|uniref:type I restriction endonuclease n=1 Tax=Sphingobacterium multivorum TaxID=28454 RepID=UPI0028A87B68|nr:type I restriction endonuclease [Sphingobacterium multivorum]